MQKHYGHWVYWYNFIKINSSGCVRLEFNKQEKTRKPKYQKKTYVATNGNCIELSF